MSKKFKMLRKPVEPSRRKLTGTVYFYNGDSIKTVLDKLPDGVDLSETTFSYYESYGDMDFTFNYQYDEREEDFQARLEKYNDDLTAYWDWYRDNKQLIEEHLAVERTEAKEAAERAKKKEIDLLMKQKRKIEKELKRRGIE